MKFLVIGTGGIGGSVGAFLASNKEDVSFISRGKALETIKNQGLIVNSGIKGTILLPNAKIFSCDEYLEKADVIILAVKDYSIKEVIPVIKKAANENTVVIPLLNGLEAGTSIKKALPWAIIADGCIYCSAFIESPGIIKQLGSLFKVIFGVKKGETPPEKVLEKIEEAFSSSGIDTILTNDIELEMFKKFSMVSSCGACGAYYDVPMGEIQNNYKYRETFIALCNEIKAIGVSLGLKFQDDIVERNLGILNSMDKNATSSLQKDIKAGGLSEIDSLIYNVLRLGKELEVETPTYKMVADKF